jgi:hypothetical protein
VESLQEDRHPAHPDERGDPERPDLPSLTEQLAVQKAPHAEKDRTGGLELDE